MAETIGFAILAAVGTSTAVGATVVVGTTTVASIVGSVVLTGALIGAQLLLAPKQNVPKQDIKQNIKQPIPPPTYAFGKCLLTPAYVFFGLSGSTSHDVLAFHDGQISRFTQFYLHEDPVSFENAVDGAILPVKERYSGNATSDVWIYHRRGLPTETAYAQMVTAFGAKWPATARGNGIASAHLICDTPGKKRISKRFPFGLPKLTAAAETRLCWDPRDPTQDPNDDATWKFTRNPVLHLLHHRCHCPAGFNQPIERVYTPTAGFWIAAADRCDEPVLTSAGTYEPRFVAGGSYDSETPRKSVVDALLRSMDGWLTERGDGSLIVYAGAYYDQGLTLDERHVIDADIRTGRLEHEKTNRLLVKFASEDHRWNVVEADPWVRQAEIDAGAVLVTKEAQAEWAGTFRQARYLAKIEMDRERCKVRGTLVLNSYGENVKGRRFFTLNLQSRLITRNLKCEVTDLVDNTLDDGTFVVEFKSVTPERYDWTPTEEGRRPAIGGDTDGDDMPTPPTPTVGIVRETIGGATVAKISATSPPVENWPDLSLTGRFRKVGVTAWREMSPPDDDVLQVLSDAVEDGNYEVQTAYVGGGGSDGDWSPTATITIISDNVAPGTPENLKVSSLSGSTVEISQRGKTNDSHTRFLRLRGGVPGTPVANMPTLDVQAGLAGDVRTFAETLTPQVKHYYGDALNGSGVASVAPAGPLVVTIPGQTFSDAFAYSDGALTTVAPANWTRIGGTAGSAQVVSGKVQAAISGTTLYAAPDTFAPNLWVSAEWLAAAASTNGIVAIVVDSSSYIWARYRGTMWELMKRVAGGSNTTITTFTTAIPAVGAEVRLEKVGAALTLKIAGTTILTGSLGVDLNAASRPGFVITTAVAGDFLDNFKAGILPA